MSSVNLSDGYIRMLARQSDAFARLAKDEDAFAAVLKAFAGDHRSRRTDIPRGMALAFHSRSA